MISSILNYSDACSLFEQAERLPIWKPCFFEPMKQTNIYIDGFNLYHNSLKKKNLYWLNIKVLVEKSLKDLTEQYSMDCALYVGQEFR